MPSLSRLACGAAAWLLADARHGAARRVIVSVGPDAPVTLTSDGRALSAAPARPHAAPRAVLDARGHEWADGRLDWPEILQACAQWRLQSTEAGVRIRAAGGSGGVAEWTEEPAAASDAVGACVELAFDPARVKGRIDEPDTLFALHALAATWPEARLILKLPPAHVGRRW